MPFIIVSVHIYLFIKWFASDLMASKIYQFKTELLRSITLMNIDSTQVAALQVALELLPSFLSYIKYWLCWLVVAKSKHGERNRAVISRWGVTWRFSMALALHGRRYSYQATGEVVQHIFQLRIQLKALDPFPVLNIFRLDRFF